MKNVRPRQESNPAKILRYYPHSFMCVQILSARGTDVNRKLRKQYIVAFLKKVYTVELGHFFHFQATNNMRKSALRRSFEADNEINNGLSLNPKTSLKRQL